MTSKQFNELSQYELQCYLKCLNMPYTILRRLENLNGNDLANMVKRPFSPNDLFGFLVYIDLRNQIFTDLEGNHFAQIPDNEFQDGASSDHKPLEDEYQNEGIPLRDLDRNQLEVFLRNRWKLNTHETKFFDHMNGNEFANCLEQTVPSSFSLDIWTKLQSSHGGTIVRIVPFYQLDAQDDTSQDDTKLVDLNDDQLQALFVVLKVPIIIATKLNGSCGKIIYQLLLEYQDDNSLSTATGLNILDSKILRNKIENHFPLEFSSNNTNTKRKVDDNNFDHFPISSKQKVDIQDDDTTLSSSSTTIAYLNLKDLTSAQLGIYIQNLKLNNEILKKLAGVDGATLSSFLVKYMDDSDRLASALDISLIHASSLATIRELKISTSMLENGSPAKKKYGNTKDEVSALFTSKNLVPEFGPETTKSNTTSTVSGTKPSKTSTVSFSVLPISRESIRNNVFNDTKPYLIPKKGDGIGHKFNSKFMKDIKINPTECFRTKVIEVLKDIDYLKEEDGRDPITFYLFQSGHNLKNKDNMRFINFSHLNIPDFDMIKSIAEATKKKTIIISTKVYKSDLDFKDDDNIVGHNIIDVDVDENA